MHPNASPNTIKNFPEIFQKHQKTYEAKHLLEDSRTRGSLLEHIINRTPEMMYTLNDGSALFDTTRHEAKVEVKVEATVEAEVEAKVEAKVEAEIFANVFARFST